MTKLKILRNRKELSYKQVKNKRSILSFLLFLCVVVCSVCVSGGVGMSNTKDIASTLLESSYINELKNDIQQYTTDLCYESGLPSQVADDSISYNKIYELEKSYIYTAIVETKDYNENAFLANVLHLKDDVNNSVRKFLRANGIEINGKIDSDIDEFSTNVSNYAKNRVRFENQDLYRDVLETSKFATKILIGLSVVVCIIIMIELLNTGHKKYRSLRYVIYSFSGAALYNIVSTIVFNLVKITRKTQIYPSYLGTAINSYINKCSYDFIMISLFILFVSICIAAISWIMKRRNI